MSKQLGLSFYLREYFQELLLSNPSDFWRTCRLSKLKIIAASESIINCIITFTNKKEKNMK